MCACPDLRHPYGLQLWPIRAPVLEGVDDQVQELTWVLLPIITGGATLEIVVKQVRCSCWISVGLPPERSLASLLKQLLPKLRQILVRLFRNGSSSRMTTLNQQKLNLPLSTFGICRRFRGIGFKSASTAVAKTCTLQLISLLGSWFWVLSGSSTRTLLLLDDVTILNNTE